MSDNEHAADLATMDDPEFLTERRRLHDEISDASEDEGPELRERYRLVEAEFLRRAGMKWQLRLAPQDQPGQRCLMRH